MTHIKSVSGVQHSDSTRIYILFFNVYLFFERETDRARAGEGAEREGDTESQAGSRLRAISTEPDVGA